jgi:hypothetical protein
MLKRSFLGPFLVLFCQKRHSNVLNRSFFGPFWQSAQIVRDENHVAKLHLGRNPRPEKVRASFFFPEATAFRRSAKKVLFRTFFGPFSAFFRPPICYPPITGRLKCIDRGPDFCGTVCAFPPARRYYSIDCVPVSLRDGATSTSTVDPFSCETALLVHRPWIRFPARWRYCCIGRGPVFRGDGATNTSTRGPFSCETTVLAHRPWPRSSATRRY